MSQALQPCSLFFGNQDLLVQEAAEKCINEVLEGREREWSYERYDLNDMLSEQGDTASQLLQDYPEQKRWCAQALRSLAGIRAEQGDTATALKHYDRVATEFGNQEFEVLQAWKAAADLLWDAEKKTEAKEYYQKIVTRFDRKEIPPVYKIILNISKKRLQ